jgi:hypothetical protein
MTVSDLERAKRRAQNLFDVWNDVTGVFHQGSSYIDEIRSVIDDAVHCGAQEATGDFKRLDGEPLTVFRMARSGHRRKLTKGVR